MIKLASSARAIHAYIIWFLICHAYAASEASTSINSIERNQGSTYERRISRRFIRKEVAAGEQEALLGTESSQGLIATLLIQGERASQVPLPEQLHEFDSTDAQEMRGGSMFLTLVFENIDYVRLSLHWDLVDKIKSMTSAMLRNESHTSIGDVHVGVFKTKDTVTARYLITVPANESALVLHDILKTDTRITSKMEDAIAVIPNIKRVKEEPMFLIGKSLSSPFNLSTFRVCNGDPAFFHAGHGGCHTYAEGQCNHKHCQTHKDRWGRTAESVCTECRTCTMAFGIKKFVGDENKSPLPCADYSTWQDSNGNSCQNYVSSEWCSPMRHDFYGRAWQSDWGIFARYQANGMAADVACCSCGGGLTTLGEIDTR
jgi:hypothetical protein